MRAFSTLFCSLRGQKTVLLAVVLLVLLAGCSTDTPTDAPDIEVSQVTSTLPPTTEPTKPAATPTEHPPTVEPSPTAEPTTIPSPTTEPAPTATSTPDYETATVTRIIDGDTIEVEMNGQTYAVRYIGIDTPEFDQPCGPEASVANAQLVAGQTARMVKDVSETDRFDRLLRYVYVGDLFVNGELVSQGWAKAVRYPPDVAMAAVLESLGSQASVVTCASVAAAATEPSRAIVVQPAAPEAPLPTSTPEPLAPTATVAPLPTAAEVVVPTVTQPPPPAAGALVIIGVNKRDEYVDIRNDGGEISLNGWMLRSEKGSQDCYLSGVIGAGQVLRIWAMASDVSNGGFNCGFGSNIWNNSEPDAALLISPDGAIVFRW